MTYYYKVSVIVPVYDVEPCLRRCLDSLINQTLKDIEIICINDCSPDNSYAILNEYAQKDERIKIISFEENQGVSMARNAGMEIAKGEYMGTVDPDDYVDTDYYEKLYSKARETDADIVHANLKNSVIIANLKYEHVYSVKTTVKIYSVSCHCLAIYRMDFLRKYSLGYPSGIKLWEDVVFLAKSLYFANKVEYVNDTFYHYVQRENSASALDIHKFLGMPLIFDFINETITDKDEYGYFLGYTFGHLINVFRRVTPKWKKIFVQDMVEIYKKRKYPVLLEKKFDYLENIDWEDADILFEKLSKLEKLNDNNLASLQTCINNLQNRKLYIWGAGNDGFAMLLECVTNNWEISSFLDSNAGIQVFNGYSVKRPEQILSQTKRDFFIIISSRVYGKEITEICERHGLKKGDDFWGYILNQTLKNV